MATGLIDKAFQVVTHKFLDIVVQPSNVPQAYYLFKSSCSPQVTYTSIGNLQDFANKTLGNAKAQNPTCYMPNKSIPVLGEWKGYLVAIYKLTMVNLGVLDLVVCIQDIYNANIVFVLLISFKEPLLKLIRHFCQGSYKVISYSRGYSNKASIREIS